MHRVIAGVGIRHILFGCIQISQDLEMQAAVYKKVQANQISFASVQPEPWWCLPSSTVGSFAIKSKKLDAVEICKSFSWPRQYCSRVSVLKVLARVNLK